MKKNVWIAIIAGAAAVVAGAVAVAAYVRKKSRALAEHLDYDPDEYFEEECSCDDEDCCCHECGAAEEAEEEEETIPLYPDETAADESEAMPEESEQE
ncbi:MAG TPA: hypothetical protein IAB51_00650 [Candidatus Merdivicinus excrementipullorum]|uniref:Uncharacterized protein n=1 Tax=Candidatus Merdivicinus excrementipullorum TaxID=2840867 RepID=A0A9D1FLD3_9FIRM|nr:hypothetical protein [Candidatus Merdivicinus excrementipullorum]